MLSLFLLLLLQDKKEPPKEPKALFAVPLSVKPGATTKVLVRGLLLDQAAAVQVAGSAEAAIKSKGKAVLPANQEASVYGDTQVEVEVKVPAGAAGELTLAFQTPAGTTAPLRVPVLEAVAEKEPNGGFAEARPLEPGKTVEGSIGGAKDVDVFKFDGKPGDTWTFEVTAARLGSPLDPLLLVHDAGGRQIALGDDSAIGRDPLLVVKIAAAGTYTLTLIDAHDQGGPTHAWLLSARRGP